VALAVEHRRAWPGRIELGGHGRQTLIGNWRRHHFARGAVEGLPPRDVIDLAIRDAGRNQPADNLQERNASGKSGTSSFDNDFSGHRCLVSVCARGA
jgi:hypothetical protein